MSQRYGDTEGTSRQIQAIVFDSIGISTACRGSLGIEINIYISSRNIHTSSNKKIFTPRSPRFQALKPHRSDKPSTLTKLRPHPRSPQHLRQRKKLEQYLGPLPGRYVDHSEARTKTHTRHEFFTRKKRIAKRPGHPRTNGQDHEKARAGGNNQIFFSPPLPNSSIPSPDFEVLNPHDNLHDFRHTLYGRSCQLKDYHDIDNQSDTT